MSLNKGKMSAISEDGAPRAGTFSNTGVGKSGGGTNDMEPAGPTELGDQHCATGLGAVVEKAGAKVEIYGFRYNCTLRTFENCLKNRGMRMINSDSTQINLGGGGKRRPGSHGLWHDRSPIPPTNLEN